MEKLKQFLNGIGVNEEVQNALFSEETPEDFNIEEVTSQHLTKRRELMLNNAEILKELKQKHNREQYPAIVKPIISKLKKFGGLSDDDVKELIKEGQSFPDIAALLDLSASAFKKSNSGSIDEQKQKYFDLQNQFNAAREAHELQLNEIKSTYETKIRQGNINRAFDGVVSQLDLIVPTKAASSALRSLMSEYQFGVENGELTVKTLDGNRVADDKDFITATDLIKRKASEFQFIKKSNGGDGGGNPPPRNAGGTPPPPPAKELNGAAKALFDRINKNR